MLTAPRRIDLLLSLEYRIEEEDRRRWRIRTTKYIYALREGPQEFWRTTGIQKRRRTCHSHISIWRQEPAFASRD
jgi:hypothetical protein